MKNIKTTISFYEFDTSIKDQKISYENMLKRIKGSNFAPFTCNLDLKKLKSMERQFINGVIELETKYLFSDQWNTSSLRVFDWLEMEVNKSIKIGYYLDITPEMESIRGKIHKCGYCGEHYQNPGICIKCIASEHICEADYPLLALQSISDTFQPRRLLLEDELQQLRELRKKHNIQVKKDAPEKARLARKTYYLKKMEKIDEEIAGKKIEKLGFTWLFENNIESKNCMYYPHTSVFCIGWETPVSKSKKADIESKTKLFPFTLQIKTFI